MDQIVLAISDAAEAGRITGKIGALLLGVWGVAKCYSISKRPTTNRKCVFALMFLCAAFAVSALSYLLNQSIPPAARAIVAVVNGVVIFGCFAATVIMAIVGLIEYTRRPAQYLQGQAQAIWALVLAFLLMFLGFIATIATRPGRYAARDQSRPGESLSFPEYNFRFSTPDKPWVKANLASLNPDARVAFMRANPEVIFLVIAEPVGPTLTREGLTDLATARLRSAATSARVIHQTEETVNGLTATRVHTEAQLGILKFSYVHWMTVTNGWAYQLITYGPQKSGLAVLENASKMIRRFNLIDFARQGHIPGHAPQTDWISTNFLMRVRMAGSGWVPWTETHRLVPGACFGAVLGDDVVLVVTPLWTFDLRPHAPILTEALLQIIGFDLDGKEKLAEREIEWGVLKGIEANFARVADSGREFVYRAKVAQARGFAYFACAWTRRDSPTAERDLSEALARVEINSPPDTPPLAPQFTQDELRSHAIAMNTIGLAYFRRGQFEASTRFFNAALDLPGPHHHATHLNNLVEASFRANKLGDALQALEARSSLVSTQRALQAQQAFLQGRLGRTEEARTNYARLFKAGYSDEAHFREYIFLLAEAEGAERALPEMVKFLESHDSVELQLAHAALLRQAKKFDAAIAILRAQREKHPFNANVATGLAESYLQAQRFTEALELSQELIKEQSEPAQALFLKGRSELGLKWYREAKESLELAAKRAPQSEDVQTYLRHVSGLLGEGANSAVRDPIAPVPIPAELLAELPAPSAEYGTESGAYYDRVVTAISFKRGQELKTTEYLRVKTLNSIGVSAFSSLQFDYNPLAEQLYVNRLEVKRANGSLVSTGRVSDYYILDQPTGEMATSRKVLNVPVSGLEPGCWLEAEVTRSELGKVEEFTFLAHPFSRSCPVRESLVLFRGDTGAIHTASSPSIQPRTIADVLCWQVKDPPLYHWEPLQASVWEYLPSFWAADRTARWPNLVSNYLHQIKDRLTLPPDLAERAREITRQTTNDTDKLLLLAHFVQTNLTYKAIEFGRRARIPQTTDDIQRNKYGDCKDHSLLLRHMLVAAGVPANLALVHFRSPVREDLPSLDQFDHMIVHVPTRVGDRFLDCTLKTLDLRGVPLGLAGKQALVLDAANPRFVRIPGYPTNANVIRSVRKLQLSTNSTLRVIESIACDGPQASFLRDVLQKMPAPNRQDWAIAALGVSATELKSASFHGLMEIHAPLNLQFDYQLPNQFHSIGPDMVGALPPCFIERWQLHARTVDKRISPFEINFPFLLESSVTVEPPLGYRIKDSVGPDARFANRFVAGNLAGQWTLPAIRYQTTLFQPPGRFPASDYPEYCRAMTEAASLLTPKLVFRKTRH